MDFFGRLPATPRGKTHILLFTHRFSSCADIFAVTDAGVTAQGTANAPINRCIPLWGCPRSILSNNGLQFCSKLSSAACELLGVFEKTPPAPVTRAVTVVWRVPTTQWLKCRLWSSTSAPKRLGCATTSRGIRLRQFGHRHLLSGPQRGLRATAPAPPSFTTFDRSGVDDHLRVARDHLAHCDLAS